MLRQHSAHCNPAEKNSAIMNLYAVSAEKSYIDVAKGASLHSEAMLELLSHLVRWIQHLFVYVPY